MSDTNNNDSRYLRDDERQSGSLAQRLHRVAPLRWMRFSFAMAIVLAFMVWTSWWWIILLLPLLGDIYLTQFIPWTWWRHSKNVIVRNVMGWIDPILYACVLVYFFFDYVGQNYQIPSSSLEKTLLVGDYLWVNKMVYGPRVPNTPVHFPLVHNTLPLLNCKSYTDSPSLSYRRLKGLRSVERYDIVVFNFPCGDTTFTKVQNPDYYTLCAIQGKDFIQAHRAELGDMIYRPVDRRENYVKRCVGLPGDTLRIKNNIVYINSHPLKEPRNVQYNYLVQARGTAIPDETWNIADVAVDDRIALPMNDPSMVMQLSALGFTANSDGTMSQIYQCPLTYEMAQRMRHHPDVQKVVQVPTVEQFNVFPIQHDYGWTRANMGSIVIPKKGMTVSLTPSNYYIYERAIRTYERNTLTFDGHSTFVINGKQTNKYTFKMDYYWMMGDNRDNSLDSRYWGFVPEDHIVGTPVIILLSLDKDKPFFQGGLRFRRILSPVNPDKDLVK